MSLNRTPSADENPSVYFWLIRHRNQRYDVSRRGFLWQYPLVTDQCFGFRLHHCAPSDYDEWPTFIGKTKEDSIWSYNSLKKWHACDSVSWN